MSYQVLARKWRPQRFPDMLGQEPVLRALVNALDSGRLHHAYLFTGMRGVGKTTIARIFAKCLNCETRGVSSSPCGECSACRDIEAGRFLDLIEVDAASRTKVEETRELLENVPYAPASGRYKVYLIDEVHMFSNASFNALLKTLEEPPEHVKFLLATTDPQKVPVTVLSRCLQFNLRRMAPGALADYLASILGSEGIEAERAALELIARASEGSVRDALSLVEQAAAFGDGAVHASDVESMLGRVSVERLLGLLEALGARDVGTLFARVDELAGYAPDFGELLGELLTLLHRLALLQSVPGGVDDAVPGHATLARLSASVDPVEVQLWYQIGQHAVRDLPYAPDPREAFDMALLRMHAFRPQATGEGSEAGTSSASASAGAPAPAPATAVLAVRGSVSAGSAALAHATVAAPSPVMGRTRDGAGEPAARADAQPDDRSEVRSGVRLDDRSVAADARSEAGVPRTEAPSADAATPPVSQGGASASAAGSVALLVPQDWSRIVGALGLSGMPRQLATQSALAAVEGGRVTLALEPGQDHLNAPRFVQRLEAALCAWAGEPITLAVRIVEAELDTPARRESSRQAASLDAARASIESDPKLARLLDAVEGTIDPASVRPIGDVDAH